MAPPDRVAPGAVLRPRRASAANRPCTGARVPREARVHHRPGPRAPGRTAEAVADGRAASEAPRDEQDHDGEVDPADGGRASLEAPSEHGGAELVLGRGRWGPQVLRGDPRGPAAPRDQERPEDQLDLRAPTPWPGVPRTHERGPEGPGPDEQGERSGACPPQQRLTRP